MVMVGLSVFLHGSAVAGLALLKEDTKPPEAAHPNMGSGTVNEHERGRSAGPYFSQLALEATVRTFPRTDKIDSIVHVAHRESRSGQGREFLVRPAIANNPTAPTVREVCPAGRTRQSTVSRTHVSHRPASEYSSSRGLTSTTIRIPHAHETWQTLAGHPAPRMIVRRRSGI